MNLNQLLDEINKDFAILDPTELTQESLKTSQLFVKYIRYWSEEGVKLELMENKKKSLLNTKRDFYTGNAPAEAYKDNDYASRKTPKSEAGIQKLIDNDPDVIRYDEQLILQKQKKEILNECMKMIKNRGYDIRAAIDFQKFINGA